MSNLLLQVFDEGRLSDSQGHAVDYRNTVILLTSNLGSDIIQTMTREEQYDEMKVAVMEVVGRHFRPEFINRIDEVVVFHPLAESQIRGIAEIQIDRLRSRLAERDLRLEISDAAMIRLVAAGLDAKLYEYEAAPHVFMAITPTREAKDVMRLLRDFIAG